MLISTNCPPVWSSPASTRFCLINPDMQYKQFKIELRNWCDEQQGTPEYDSRVKAAAVFDNCYKSELKDLNLSDFDLTSIPSAIRFLQSLRSINFQNNQLVILPPEICDLEGLEILNLGNNYLQNIPSELTQLSNLKILILDNNPINALPVGLFLMKNKCKISLTGCPFV